MSRPIVAPGEGRPDPRAYPRVAPRHRRDIDMSGAEGNAKLTAMTGATLGELGSVPEMPDLLRSIFAECADVAQRLGISFPVSLDRRLAAGLAVGDHKTSMLQDLAAGRKLEFECMTGAVVELAAHLNVPVPSV